MTNDPITFIFSSPAWMRLVIDLVLLGMVRFVRNTNHLPGSRFLLAIPIIMIARDLIAFALPHPVLFFVAEISIIACLIWWLYSYQPRFIHPWIATGVLTLVTATLASLAIVFPNLLTTTLSNLFLIALSVYLVINVYNVSEFNTREADFTVRHRRIFSITFLLTHSFYIFVIDNRNPFIQYAVYTSLATPIYVLMFAYIRYYDNKFKEREDYNHTYTNSLFNFMKTIGSAMTERIEVKAVINYVIKSITRTIQTDAGVVYLWDAEENGFKPGAWEGHFPPLFEVPAIVKTKITGIQKYFENTPIARNQTIIGECAASGKPIFIRMAWEDPRMEINTKDESLLISSIIVAPLVVNKEIFGVVAIMRRQREKVFTDDDFDRAKIFIEYASITLDSLYSYAQLLEKQEIEREVSIAASIQKKLLPGRIPSQISSLISAYSVPAKGVSGDYYDIIPLTREGKFAVVICDVAGKGVPASLIMVMIRTIVHTVGGSRKNAAEIVKLINRGIAGRVDIERFATLSYMTYDPTTSELQYSNAGHHPLILYRTSTNAMEKVDSPGLPIGLERDSEYQLVNIKLESGDTIVTYTDGIIEAMDPRGEQFEEERLKTAVMESVLNSPKEMVSYIRKQVDEFVGQAKQHDDMTLIVLKAR